MIFGKVAQNHGQAGRHPAISASPEEGPFGVVIEQAIVPLEGVHVHFHLAGRPVDIFAVAGDAVGLGLEDGDHIHVINPQAGLGGVAVREEFPLALNGEVAIAAHPFAGVPGGVFPLMIGIAKSHFQGPLVAIHQVDLQGNGSEDGEVHVVVAVAFCVFLAKEGLKEVNQPVLQFLVVAAVGELDGVHPKAYHGIIRFVAASIGVGGLIARKVFSVVQRLGGEELLGYAVADGLDADVFGQVFEVLEGDSGSAGCA